MSRRTEQLGSTLRRAIQSVIEHGLADPRLQAMITVTNVKVTEDLLTAVVCVTVTPESKEDLALHGLRAASRHIRRKAGDLVDMRKLPEFTFKIDRGQKRQAEVLRILTELSDEESAAQTPDDGTGSISEETT